MRATTRRSQPPVDRLSTAEILTELAAAWDAHLAQLPALETLPPEDVTILLAKAKRIRADLALTRKKVFLLDAWTNQHWWCRRQAPARDDVGDPVQTADGRVYLVKGGR